MRARARHSGRIFLAPRRQKNRKISGPAIVDGRMFRACTGHVPGAMYLDESHGNSARAIRARTSLHIRKCVFTRESLVRSCGDERVHVPYVCPRSLSNTGAIFPRASRGIKRERQSREQRTRRSKHIRGHVYVRATSVEEEREEETDGTRERKIEMENEHGEGERERKGEKETGDKNPIISTGFASCRRG